MIAVGLLVAAYVFGSIPWGLWLVKAVKGVDVREVGSGNIGTTNVYRAAGKGITALVFALDVLKGYAPCLAAMALGLAPEWVVAAGAAAIVGHSKSLFMRFAGGKSVATGIGTVLAIQPVAAVAVLLCFAAIVGATRMVSAGSVGAALALPFALLAVQAPPTYVAYGAAAALYVVVRHRENLGRIRAGTEARL